MTVRDREFFSPIDSANRIRIRIRIRTDHGEVVDFVAQYETMIGDTFRPVVRYDLSHGRAHRDILNPVDDTSTKQWLPNHLSEKQAIDYAERDLRANWQQYRDRYLERVR